MAGALHWVCNLRGACTLRGGMNGGLHRVCTSEGWVWERSSTFGPCALCTYVRMCVHTRLLCKGSGPPWHMLQLFWGAGGLYEAPMFVPVHGQSSVTGLGDAPAFFFQPGGAIGCVLATMSPGRLCHACAAGSGSTGSARARVYVPHPAAVHQLVGNREAALP